MSPRSAHSPREKSWANWNGWPVVILTLATLLRVLHIWNSRHNPTFWAPAVDPAWYDDAAMNILSGHWGPFPLFRAPLYPALLAAVYGIFGHDLVAARLLNVALQGVTIWAVWRIGRRFLSPAVGILAAALLAVNGTAVYFANEILSTSLEMLAAALGLWATLRLTHDRGLPAVLLCGLAWGLAALVRPNYLILFPVILIAVLAFRAPLSLRTAGLALLVWLAGAFAPILPVTAANVFRGGEFVLIATQGGVNFWIGNNPESTGALSVLPGYGNMWRMEDAEREAERELGHPPRPGELSNFYYDKGWSFLAENPWQSLRFMIRKTLLFFNRFEISNNKHILHFAALSPWLPPLLWLNFGLLVPFALLGIWTAWRTHAAKLLLGLAAVYTISVVLFFVTARFRMPAVPWLSLLAAAGMIWIVERLRRRTRSREWLPLLALIAGVVLTHMNPWGLREAPTGWARYMEGNAHLKLGNLDSARVAFMDAYREGQTLLYTQLNLGVISYREGKYAEARRWYELALEENPRSDHAWNNLGIIAEAEGDTARAIECYQRALELRPAADDPRHNLAGIFFRRGVQALHEGRDSAAVASLEDVLRLTPTAITFYDLALAHGRLNHPADAVRCLDSALARDPYLAPARALKEQLRNFPEAFPTGGASVPDRD
ncbi:MAG: tetratricopeptide repeat protein [bacterium]|nr:tetratricopeptide repeat protein [bacterium]